MGTGEHELHFPLWFSLNLSTYYGLRHAGNSVQKDSKSQNVEGTVTFSLSLPLKAQAQHFTGTQYQHFRAASMVR